MSILEHNIYLPEEQEKIGSKFLISNGYMGYRGTLDEADSSDFVALNLNGLYDGSQFIETVNVFNPLFTLIKADGIDLNPKSFRPVSHNVSLDTDNGVFKRTTEFKYCEIKISLKSERFMDQTNKSMMYSKFSFKANSPVVIELYSGIDNYIWNINEHHLVDQKYNNDKNTTIISAKTKYQEKNVCIGLREDFDFKAKEEQYKPGIKKHTFTLEANKNYTITKYISIIHSVEDCLEKTKSNLETAYKTGYTQLLNENQAWWDNIYQNSRVNVFNNDEVMLLADYSVYQLIAHRPYSNKVSINQKGLSGQYLGGSVGWNTEIMILPFYTNVDPISAKYMIQYRINSLDEAVNKAKSLGYEGAYFSEYSGESGIELSKNEVKNNVHINASIVYGMYQYIERTKDYDILFEGGLITILEASRFYLSYSTLSDNKKHYDFLNIKGLDDTHGNVDNEAYTNQMIKNCLDSTIKCVAFAKGIDKFKVKDLFEPKNYEQLISDLRELRRKLYTKKENIEYLIESHDKYLNLEDRDVTTLKRVSFINDLKLDDIENTTYLNNPNVISMLALFLDEYSDKVKKTNFDYYMRRTINPDIFTRINYVIIGCASNNTEAAYKQFMELTKLDISNDYLFKDGLDMTLIAGIYDMLVYGFAGLRHHGFLLAGDYNEAQKIRRLEFKVMIANNVGSIKIKRNSVSISFKDE